MNAQPGVLDWIRGEPGIAYQRCARCRAVWYFQRDFCPRCGARETARLQASGRGVVYTITLVHRAPREALRARTPYAIVLVDAEEGFRMMALGDASLAIGRRVHARFRQFGDALVPYFEALEE
jgi:uncharacterized OB-fold protein